MNKFILIFLVLLLGCGNLSPRMEPKIDNQNGQIDEIKNNQNGVIAEIGKLKQMAEVQNSTLKEIQNGLLNINASLSKNENSGVQILQGDGALIMVFSVIVIGMILWYRNKAVKQEAISNVLAKEIAKFNDPVLNDRVLISAQRVKEEKNVLNMLNKHI